LEFHNDFVALGKTFAVAFAVGLDVLAISVGVGVSRLTFNASLRLGWRHYDAALGDCHCQILALIDYPG